MTRVGVIGVGAMGRHHARVYSEMEGVELVGVADVDGKKAKEIAEMYGTNAYTNHKELLKRDLDAVSVAVPTTLHKDVALDVIDAGVHLLVEKPIADSLENACTIINAAEDAGLKLMVGHIERFNPAVMALNDLMRKNMLGDVVSISGRRVGPYPPRIKDVGVIIDIAIHDIDVISFLYGEPAVEVYAIAGNGSRHFEHEDYASILLRYGDNKSGVVEANWLTPRKIRRLSVIGVERVAYLDYINQRLILDENGEIRDVEVKRAEPLKNELTHFIDAVERNSKIMSSGEEGLKALKIAIAAVMSYKRRSVIRIDNLQI